METQPRSSLFKDTLIQLDSAAEEAAEQGAEELANYILDMLIPFIEDQQIMAYLEEAR
jgi:hypothetical protein